MSEADNELLNYSIHDKYLVIISDSKFIVEADSIDKVFDILVEYQWFMMKLFNRFYYKKFNFNSYIYLLFENSNKYDDIYKNIEIDNVYKNLLLDKQLLRDFIEHSYYILEGSHAFNFKIERLDKITVINQT